MRRERDLPERLRLLRRAERRRHRRWVAEVVAENKAQGQPARSRSWTRLDRAHERYEEAHDLCLRLENTLGWPGGTRDIIAEVSAYYGAHPEQVRRRDETL